MGVARVNGGGISKAASKTVAKHSLTDSYRKSAKISQVSEPSPGSISIGIPELISLKNHG